MTPARLEPDADRLVDEWRALCRIPSVSGERAEVERAAAWIERRMAPVFDEVRRVELELGPLLIATVRGSGAGRLLLYTHYDVRPAGDLGDWTAPPFSAELRDGAVWARGACDDKADVTARIQALERWRGGLTGPPPFEVVMLCDPAEEIGSPGLAEALRDEAASLSADACLWESFLRGSDGRPGIGFGCRGSLEVSLTLHTLRAAQHTAFAPVLRSAPIELMRAVASLTDATGALCVPGLLASVREPTPEQAEAAARLPLPREEMAIPGSAVDPLAPVSEHELRRRLSFAPSLAVCEASLGDGGTGAVAPAAQVTLRFGLVPDQEPAQVLDALRAHLRDAGFDDVDVECLRTLAPAAAPLRGPFAEATIAAAADAYGEPVVYPVMIGAGPGRMVLDLLGAPIVSVAGTLRPDGNMHGPDEHGAVSDYLDHVRFTANLLERLGATGL